MPLAFAAFGLAVLFVVSGLKGTTVGEVFTGQATKPLDPTGGPSATPIDENHFAPTSSGAATGAIAPVGDMAVIQKLIAEMDRIDRLHKTYAWGGGHLGYSDNGPWDCSGAVSQALHKVGLLHGAPLTSGLLMLWGEMGPGKRVTVFANPVHTFMEVDGKYWGTSHSNPGGGPGWMPAHDTRGYAARHPSGL